MGQRILSLSIVLIVLLCFVFLCHQMRKSIKFTDIRYSKKKISTNATNMNSPEYSLSNHVKLIRTWGKPGEKVLDFGAGTGLFTSYLKMEGFLVEGVEFKKKAIDYAMKRYGLNFFESLNELKAETSTTI